MKFILEYFRVENFWGTAKKCVLSKVIQKMEGIVLSKFFFFDSSRLSRYKDSNFIEVNITQRL